METKQKWKGAATVEAAIVMPVVIILLVLMLMFALFIYEKAAARAICNQIAAEGAALWYRGPTYMEEYYAKGGLEKNYTEQQGRVHIYSIYANAFTNLVDTQKSQKEEILKEELRKRFARHSFLLSADEIQVDVNLQSVLIHKTLEVNISANYELLFFSSGMKISAQSVIAGQTEFIRTLDLAEDLITPYFLKQKEGYQRAIQRLKDLLQKIKIEK